MAEHIPQRIFERLEREWRLIEPDRQTVSPKPVDVDVSKRIKIGRHD